MSSLPPALRDWGQHPFCYIDWHMSNVATIRYSDAPTPLALSDRHESLTMTSDKFEGAIKALKAEGWQQIVSAPNQEGKQVTLMRAPAMEEGYDTCAVLVLDQGERGLVNGVYQLGKNNERLIDWKLSSGGKIGIIYADTHQYLTGEGWEQVSVQQYPYYGRTDRQHQLYLYRRKAKAKRWFWQR